ncbi:MAG: pbpF 1 [Frankiales bacterium]|nr:pbpF 1 [Frankiales bacterium]
MLLVGALSLVVGTGAFVGGLLAAPIDFAVAPPPTAALLTAADGRQFATILPPERRDPVAASEIPQVMRDAIISAEDERFLKHNGVDPLATVRAVFRDLSGGVSQGGSTLTQQYVKNAYVGNERSAMRKIREAALAVRLEQKLSKQEILTDYLNALYLGNGLYGVQAASKYYFGVPVKDLDVPRHGPRDPLLAIARASILAGIAPAPSAWNPVKDFTTARLRQQYTLNRMVVGGFITPQQASDAYSKREYIQLVRPVRQQQADQPTEAPEFADYVKAKIKASPGYDEDVFFRGSLRVKTTLDLDLQKAFNQAIKEVLPRESDPQAAIVAVDYRNGDIKAMATRRYVPPVTDRGKLVPGKEGVKGYQQKLGFNLATNALRQSGSTIKPFTLAQALIEGLTLNTTRYGPGAKSIPNPGGVPNPYVLHNSEPSEAGSFTLRRALAKSVNTVYGPLAIEVGRTKVAKLAKAAGLSGKIEPGPLSFGVGGSVEVTPLSEAVAYATFANGGVHIAPRTYTEVRANATGTNPGQVVQRAAPSPSKRVMSASVAGDVVKALTDVVQYGTATSVKQDSVVFGKTGTTNSSTDAWFTGCIPDEHICVATWMGNEYSSCDLLSARDPATKKRHALQVQGSCGGMHDIEGVRGQIFGGTLPAKIFARAQQIYKQIQADTKARAAGLAAGPAATSTAAPVTTSTRHPRRTPSPTPAAQVAPTRTVAPRPTKTVPPTQAPTSAPPIIIPSQPPPPSPSPT